MMNRTIHRRLHRLEARVLPASKQIVLLIEYVNATGEVVETVEFGSGRDEKPLRAAAPPRSRPEPGGSSDRVD
jgi:hypothetical protein